MDDLTSLAPVISQSEFCLLSAPADDTEFTCLGCPPRDFRLPADTMLLPREDSKVIQTTQEPIDLSLNFDKEFGSLVDVDLINEAEDSNLALGQKKAIKEPVKVGNVVVYERPSSYYTFMKVVRPVRDDIEFAIKHIMEEVGKPDQGIQPFDELFRRCKTLADCLKSSLSVIDNLILDNERPGDHSIVDGDVHDQEFVYIVANIDASCHNFSSTFLKFQGEMYSLRQLPQFEHDSQLFYANWSWGAGAYLRREKYVKDSKLFFQDCRERAFHHMESLETMCTVYRQDIEKLSFYMYSHRTNVMNWGPLNMEIETAARMM